MVFDFDYLGDNRWRLKATHPSGKVTVREGELALLTRLAVRAESLLAHWARSRAEKTTLPAAPASIPSIRSAVRLLQLRSTLHARAQAAEKKKRGS
jgi:hypothetical protein